MATFTGTIGDDSLVGGAGNDSLIGLDGNDTLNGGAGADVMVGDVGNDLFLVDSLGDVVVEGYLGGDDTIRTALLDGLGSFSLMPHFYVENLVFTGVVAAQLRGNSLDNQIDANSAAAVSDTLYGAGGHDILNGFGGDDSLIGGSGNDLLDGGNGTDMMIGGSGNDNYMVDSLTDRVYEYSHGGFDTITSIVQKDLRQPWSSQVEGLTYTGAAAATLHGNKLGNLITSLAATNDSLFGYEGNDSLEGGAGTDSMTGGIGNDFYFASATDIVKELVDEGTDSIVGTRSTIAVGDAATTIENLFFTGAAASIVNGNGLDNIVSGGAANNTVNGAVGDDSLAGGAGADSLVGSAGNDLFYGGGLASYSFFGGLVPDAAIDTLSGGFGNDLYWIDSLIDKVVEPAGASGGTLDVVVTSIDNSLTKYANVEGMWLREGSEAWSGRGSAVNDIIVGNSGDNFLHGAGGNDTLSGNTEQLYYFNFASDVLEGGPGDDVLVAFAFGTYYYAAYEESTLFGGIGNDLYALGAGNLSGGDLGFGGQDIGGTDTAVLFGDASIEALEGVENLILYGAGGAAETQARGALDAVWAVSHNGALYTAAIPSVYTGVGNEIDNSITGNGLGNVLKGLAGNDTILGGAGNDSLHGGDGMDSLIGGPGDDWFYAETGDDVVEAAASGFDILASATLTSYAAFANIEGLQYLGSTDVDLNNGGGNVSNDFFGGGSGNDVLLGFGGNDTLTGGLGNDSIDGDTGVDSLQGGDGLDTVQGGAGNDSMQGGAGNDSMLGGAGSDQIYGDDGNDTVDGGDDADTVYGGLGADSLNGGAANDQLYAISYYQADTSNNTLNGGAGNDGLYGSDGNDVLSGGDGNDNLVGDDGADILNGGTQTNSGAYYSPSGDVLWGGAQYTSGSTDADQFRFDAPTAANKALETFSGSGSFYFNTGSLVADFVSGSDKLRFASSMVGDNDATLENVSVQAAPGAFSNTAEMVIFRTDVVESFNSSYFLSYFDASEVTSVIGSAANPFATGAERLFVVDNGTSSAIFQFTSANADAVVTQDELSLLAIVTGITTLASADFGLF